MTLLELTIDKIYVIYDIVDITDILIVRIYHPLLLIIVSC